MNNKHNIRNMSVIAHVDHGERGASERGSSSLLQQSTSGRRPPDRPGL